MEKENLAYKLALDVLKHYKIEELEEKYKLSGGKLIVAIYNEIYNELNLTQENNEPVVFIGEDLLAD